MADEEDDDDQNKIARILYEAVEAWGALERNWEHYLKIIPAIQLLSNEALFVSKANSRRSNAYQKEYSRRWKEAGFSSDITIGLCSRLLWFTEEGRLAICDEIWKDMTPTQKRTVTSPDTMYQRTKKILEERGLPTEVAGRTSEKKPLTVQLKEAKQTIADLEEKVAGRDINTDQVAAHWYMSQSAEHISLVLVNKDPEKARRVIALVNERLADAEKFDDAKPTNDAPAADDEKPAGDGEGSVG